MILALTLFSICHRYFFANNFQWRVEINRFQHKFYLRIQILWDQNNIWPPLNVLAVFCGFYLTKFSHSSFKKPGGKMEVICEFRFWVQMLWFKYHHGRIYHRFEDISGTWVDVDCQDHSEVVIKTHEKGDEARHLEDHQKESRSQIAMKILRKSDDVEWILPLATTIAVACEAKKLHAIVGGSTSGKKYVLPIHNSFSRWKFHTDFFISISIPFSRQTHTICIKICASVRTTENG